MVNRLYDKNLHLKNCINQSGNVDQKWKHRKKNDQSNKAETVLIEVLHRV